jgi:hypothetical protein
MVKNQESFAFVCTAKHLYNHRREMREKDYVGAFALAVCGIAFMCLFYYIGYNFVFPGQG